MLIEVALVLAIPAFLVLGLAVYFEATEIEILVGLAIAFILSWVIIIYRVMKMHRET